MKTCDCRRAWREAKRKPDGWAARLEALQAENERLKRVIRDMARNDNSRYEHHQPRSFDGKSPAPGTIWLTPREIARRALGEPDLATTAELLRRVT